MRARLLLLLAALLLPVRAAAELRVMCYGDSITSGMDTLHQEDSYPGQLQRLRGDLDVVNEGRVGDVSDDFERFRAALTDWPPHIVVLMLGANDAVCQPGATPFCDANGATPERTVGNLLRMAEEARGAGAAVVILTPTPAVCGAACEERHDVAFDLTMRNAFTARVAATLRRTRLPPGVRVADLRAKLPEASWESLSFDGLHPTFEGNRTIAQFVAAHLQEKRSAAVRQAPKRQVTKRAAVDEPDPFLRSPEPRSSPR